MSYYSVTNTYVKPMELFVYKNWTQSPNFATKHLLSRAANLGLSPLSFTSRAIDTIVVVGVMFGGVVHSGAFKFAISHLESSQTIFSDPYQSILFCFNPNAKFVNYEAGQLSKKHRHQRRNAIYISKIESLKDHLRRNPTKTRLSLEGEGLVTDFINKNLSLQDLAKKCDNSENYLKRHVGSRLTYLSLALSSLITRIIDFIVGLLAAIVSLSIFGTSKFLNTMAYRELTGSALIKDLSFCAAKIINPWAGASPRS
jgi:hypothetical protein